MGLPFAVVSVLFWGWVKDQSGDTIEERRSVPPVMMPPGRNVYVALGDSFPRR